MRAAPAFQISLHRFGVWRCGVLLIALLGAAALAAWIFARAPTLELAPTMLAAVAGVGWVWLVASLVRVSAMSLRWDGSFWHLGTSGETGDASLPGELTVAIDLGAWMLLRFEPAPATAPSLRRARPIWIPAQRRGIEAQWHGLRCAVYGARPATEADASIGR
jgi:hypothetical protein